MPQQPTNPLQILPDGAKASDKSGEIARIGEQIADPVLKGLEELTVRLELNNRVRELIITERDIETLTHLEGEQHPKASNQLREFASMKANLEDFVIQHKDFLSKYGVGKISYDELKEELLNPTKWWQFWRSRAAAKLLRPS
jgi:hypothetical protein